MRKRIQLCFACALAASCGRLEFDAPSITGNLAFVTSTAYDVTTFGSDLSGADAACNERARVAGLPGRYVAYLSTSALNARDRLAGARGWWRTDGRPFVDRIDDLTMGHVLHPLRADETGAMVSQSPKVATGTTNLGIKSSATCSDYTDPGGIIAVGSPTETGDGWVAFPDTPPPCTTSLRLYCFGIDLDEPLQIQPASGRLAFLSIQGFTAGGGITSADELCRTEAAQAGIPRDFLALLPTVGAAAGSRFSLTGPNWTRVDGIPLAESPLAFMNGDLIATPNVTALGGFETRSVITGGQWLSMSSSTCTDWTDPTATNVMLGLSNHVGSRVSVWTSSFAGCDGRAGLYCLEP
jgi:hypothetical protein